MDPSSILELIDQLDDDVDDLEESLAPLVKTALSESASKLPLLDMAKLYILVTYAIESILFSYLRINGVKAREHPVFKELTRVRQYFDKIKALEAPPAERTMVVDKGAATRFIKAGLAGNDKYDLERAEREAKEKARAQMQLEKLNQEAKKRKIEEIQSSESSTSSSDSSSDDEQSSPRPEQKKLKTEDSEAKPKVYVLPSKKRAERRKNKGKGSSGVQAEEVQASKSKKKRKGKKDKSKAKASM